MKFYTSVLILAVSLVFGHLALAEEVSETDSRVGVGKAVESFDKEQGFKLSPKAMKALGIQFQSLSGNGPWKVSKSSLVHLKQSAAVYRRYDGWISMVLVKIVSQDVAGVWIKAADLEAGDDVAVQGVPFLRMTDSDLNAGTVDSCAH